MSKKRLMRVRRLVHKCDPVWLVAIVEGEEQPVDEAYRQVRAPDEEEAAEAVPQYYAEEIEE